MKNTLLRIPRKHGMSAAILIAPLWFCGCSPSPPNTSSNSKDGVVQMKFVGIAASGLTNDPINGCRVYAFQMDGYTQTAIYCKGNVTVASSHHQKNDDDSESSDE